MNPIRAWFAQRKARSVAQKAAAEAAKQAAEDADKKQLQEEEEAVCDKIREGMRNVTEKLEARNWSVIDKWNKERVRGELHGTLYALDPGNHPYKVFVKQNGAFSLHPIAPEKEKEIQP